MLPRLIVFDFHGVLSLSTGRGKFIGEFEKTLKIDADEIFNLKTGNIKNALRPYRINGWYSAMVATQISPYLLMPTLNEVIYFVRYMKEINPQVYFSIASMGEEDSYMFDMMRYCFESQNEPSPFTMDLIVGNIKDVTKSLSPYDKLIHINIIINNIKAKNPNIILDPSYSVLIDDSERNINFMTMQGICCVFMNNYFTLEDWNKGCVKLID